MESSPSGLLSVAVADPDWWNCSRISNVPKWLQKSIAHLKWCVSLSAGVRLLKPLSSFSSIGFLLRIDGTNVATEHYHVICLVSFSFPNSKLLRKSIFIVCQSFQQSVVVFSVRVWIPSRSKELLQPVKGIVYSLLNGLYSNSSILSRGTVVSDFHALSLS